MPSDFKHSINGLKEAQKGIQDLEKVFTKLEDLEKIFRKINFIVVKRLTPMLRAMLVDNYKGVGVISGDLKAAVANSYISIGKKGISIKLGAGYDKKVYVRASVFRRYKDFYNLTPAQVQTLGSAYTKQFQIEVSKVMKKIQAKV